MSKEGNKTRHIGSFVNQKNESKNQTEGKNYLLVIAIDEYEHCPKLYNAVKDAQDIIEILTTRYQFESQNTLTLINENATEENILQTFRQLAGSVTPDDNLIIYFSGHGEYDDVFKEGYWVPVNAKQGAIQDYVPNSKIKTVLNAIKSRHTFLIIDSCFSGSLFMQYRSSGLAERLERDPSRWGLTAGRNEIVADGEAGKNSPFADSLIYHLGHSDKSIGASELCNKVIEDVIANANQTPRGEPLKVEGHRGGQFFFHLKDHIHTYTPSKSSQHSKPTFSSQDINPNLVKKKSYLPYIIGAIGIIALMFGFNQYLKSKKPAQEITQERVPIEPEKTTNLNSPSKSESNANTKVDRIKNRREQIANNRSQTQPDSKTKTPTINKSELWKSEVFPYLKKGEEYLKLSPPNFTKAEEYFKRGVEAASENGLNTDEAMKYLQLLKEKKAEFEKQKELEVPKTSKHSYGTITDRRDGKKYKTINLFGRDWMAEDLKYEMPNNDSHCYNDDDAYCNKYGRFYKWEDAMKACPLGWKLPSNLEWKQIINKYGRHQYALPKLIRGGESGFEIMLSGERSSRKTWANLNQSAEYWTNYEADSKTAYAVNFSNLNGDRPIIYYPKANKNESYYLCRCIKK